MANEWIKKVEQAAHDFSESDEPLYGGRYYWDNESLFGEQIKTTFKAGAKWALSHQWIDVNDELPEEDDIYYVLINYRGHFLPSVTDFETETKSWTGYSNISHWMPIPKMEDE